MLKSSMRRKHQEIEDQLGMDRTGDQMEFYNPKNLDIEIVLHRPTPTESFEEENQSLKLKFLRDKSSVGGRRGKGKSLTLKELSNKEPTIKEREPGSFTPPEAIVAQNSLLTVVDLRKKRERILRQKSSTETSGLGSSIDYSCTSNDNLSQRSPSPSGLASRAQLKNLTAGTKLRQQVNNSSAIAPRQNVDTVVLLTSVLNPTSSSHVTTKLFDCPAVIHETNELSEEDNMNVSCVAFHANHAHHSGTPKKSNQTTKLKDPNNDPTLSNSFKIEHPEGTWSAWSAKRRNSYNKRVNENSQPAESERISTPVIRARQESKALFSPELVTVYLPHEHLEAHCKKEQKRAAVPTGTKAKRGRKHANTVSVQEIVKQLPPDAMRTLYEYWEHDMFVRARSWSLCFAVIGLGLSSFCIGSSGWLFFGDEHHPNHAGLWLVCQAHNDSCSTTFFKSDTSAGWQKAVLGLLLFSVLFAFLGSVLSFAAICVTSLAKKIYYYHSAGEIFFVSAMTSSVGMLMYPLSIDSLIQLTGHSYGYAYFLGWASCLLYILACICMMLDEIIKETTKPLTSLLCCIPQRRPFRQNNSIGRTRPVAVV